MKIIDLLNKIANGEELPNEIKYRNIKFLYDETNKHYIVKNCDEYNDLLMAISNNKGIDLNYEVEIPEEKKDNFTGWKMYQDGKEVCSIDCLVEEKKIPEKLDKYVDVSDNLACEWSFAEKKLKDKINEIINYLKSKGE